jgi:hypothetical protein
VQVLGVCVNDNVAIKADNVRGFASAAYKSNHRRAATITDKVADVVVMVSYVVAVVVHCFT